jgi:hypothetical protein
VKGIRVLRDTSYRRAIIDPSPMHPNESGDHPKVSGRESFASWYVKAAQQL